MISETNTTMTTSKVLLYVQMAASIVPIFAHIALLIMAWIQNNWMMLAMIIPSIMMYIASLVPQILQYINQRQYEQKIQNAQQSNSESQLSNIPDSNVLYGQKYVENLPDTLTPVSLETLLMTRSDSSSTQLPWKTVLHEWLKHSNTDLLHTDLLNFDYKSNSSVRKLTQAKSAKNQLIAPLGVGYNGYCYIDLISNGPHALVAGTTGSGKSVLLTTWCLALAFQYSPQQLRFVFLDFKGGATFDILSKLPHAMGNVGDLNLKHATRALRGLELELDRRERLVSMQGCHNISQVTPSEPSLLIVIDEFHALKDQLPDYMPRLIRIASVGRSLGMHIIAGTQNPLGQVSADMKANISINICLRVRDSLQSQELLGTSHAAKISPNTPGSAYYNIGEGVEALRCAQSRNAKRLVKAIQFAGKFCYLEHSKTLFSAPLPSILSSKQLENYKYENYENKYFAKKINQESVDSSASEESVVIGLQDDSINLFEAKIPLNLGNIAIIGGRQQGKSTILRIISQKLQTQVYSANEITAQEADYIRDTAEPVLIDDADELLDPLNTKVAAISLQNRLHCLGAPVILSAQSARYLRLPEQAPVRIIFPTGDIGTDALLGIPSALSKTFSIEDYQLPGRCVLVTPGSANLTQIALPN